MLKKTAEQMVKQALRAVDPYTLIQNQVSLKNNILSVSGKEFLLQDFGKIYVIGCGKAAAPMAAAMEDILGDRLHAGAVVVKYGHSEKLKKISLYEAAHPVPDENCLAAGKKLITLAEQAGSSDLVIVLISGGGSALFDQLPSGISLQDLAELNKMLLDCGADIEEINTLRKHISLVKGGRLAGIISPAVTVSLILSDVIGDPLESIASGPSAPDSTSFEDALQILEKYKIKDAVPAAVYRRLKNGSDGKVQDTPKADNTLFDSVYNFIIGSNSIALDALEREAAKAGFNTFILSDRLQGEAGQTAKVLAAILKSSFAGKNSIKPPACLIAGGEPTVTIKGSGLGGRNQELVLAVLLELKKTDIDFYFCSIGTDGTDGPTDAAGAWIDQDSCAKAQKLNLDMQSYLEDNDAYHFFEKMEQLVKTGPTRTNVMDIIFCLF